MALFFPRGGNNYSIGSGACPECPTTAGTTYDYGLPYAWLEHSSETITGGNYGGSSKSSGFGVDNSKLVFDVAILGGGLFIVAFVTYKRAFNQK